MGIQRIPMYPYPESDLTYWARQLSRALNQEAVERIQDFNILSLSHVPWKDVRAYGAVGNGVADDTAVIQAAINAAGAGGVIVFQGSGNIYQFEGLTVTNDDVHFIGIGNPKLRSDYEVAGYALDVSGDNFTMENIEVEYTGEFYTKAPENGPARSGIRITGDNARLRNITVSGFSYFGIAIQDPAANAVIRDCDCSGNGYAGGHSDLNTNNILFSGGRYSTNGSSNGNDGYGIAVHGSNQKVIGVSTSQNYSRGIDCHKGTNIIFANNYCEDEGTKGINGVGIYITDAVGRVVITGNIVRNMNQTVYAGISFHGDGSGTGVSEGVISNNIVEAIDGFGIMVIVDHTDTLIVNNNIVKDCLEDGIRIATTDSDVATWCKIGQVCNNVIYNACTADYGMRISGFNDVLVANNTLLFDADARSGQPDYAIYKTGNITGKGQFHNNYSRGHTVSVYLGGYIATPTTGSWEIGDMVWNTAPEAGGTPGWSCINRQDTQIRVQANATDTTIEVDSTTGMLAGDVIGIRLDNGIIIHRSISSITDADTLVISSGISAGRYAPVDADVFTNRWTSLATLNLGASATWDPGSIADGDEEAKEVTVTGAALGDFAVASFSLDVTDLVLNAQVTGANTVTCVLSNNTGGAVDLGSGTVYVKVTKK